MKLKIAPSILSADRNNLQKEVEEIERYAELLHVDIMDGKFVPPKTFIVAEIKKVKSSLPKDVHLMVDHPLKDGFIDDFIDAGADIITIHEECKDGVDECIDYIKKKGVKAGITINPGTPLEKLKPYINKVDMILIMSVNPGYAGQKFMPEVLPKIAELRKLKPEMDIQIDGGLTKDTIRQAVKAGANVIVAGSSIFKKPDRIQAIKDLRDAAEND